MNGSDLNFDITACKASVQPLGYRRIYLYYDFNYVILQITIEVQYNYIIYHNSYIQMRNIR